MFVRTTTSTRRRVAVLASILLAALLVIPTSAGALSDPSVTELLTEGVGAFGADVLTFTVINPSDSSVGEIVGFVVESDPPSDIFAPIGWKGSTLWESRWDQAMPVVGANMTWSQFFGGINYPFDGYSTGFFLDYFPDAVNIPTFSFLNTYAAISHGETLTGFNIELGGPMSNYVLAHVNNAGPGFDTNGFSTINGETTIIPEPSTAVLLGLGLLGALAAARRLAHH